MSWSLGELSALCVKAARGAGMSWGMAQEVGWAVRWLSRSGHGAAGALADRLRHPGRADCPFMTGLAFCESDGAVWQLSASVQQPILCLPFLARCVPASEEWNVGLGETDCRLTKECAWLNEPTPTVSTIEIKGVCRSMTKSVCPRAVEPNADDLSTLLQMAGNTYAPSTPESRLRGAGAGLNDAD